ncbi:MAG: metal-dependent hydrolase [Bacteroidetes bacterium]|nr:metal-dependent hydrolase [Bacteroidota bacterium]MBL0016627.1 metal-dependent hydrolase [Bacteroidota bacterium]
MIFKYYGHSCFAIEVAGKTLLFDPFISGNPLAGNVQLADIKADYILISHAHGDHVADAVALAKQTGATCVSNYEIITWLQNQGVAKGHPMNHGGQWKFEFGTVKYVNAVHSSSFPDGSYGGNPGGFIVDTVEGTFYFAGDTALTADMKIWGKQFEFDFVVLPIGDNFTMGIDDAAKAADFLRCEKVIGVHFDTFPYIVVDHELAKHTFQKAGSKLFLPEIGKSIEF